MAPLNQEKYILFNVSQLDPFVIARLWYASISSLGQYYLGLFGIVLVLCLVDLGYQTRRSLYFNGGLVNPSWGLGVASDFISMSISIQCYSHSIIIFFVFVFTGLNIIAMYETIVYYQEEESVIINIKSIILIITLSSS